MLPWDYYEACISAEYKMIIPQAKAYYAGQFNVISDS
jgi:hypothetical protein